VSNTKPEAVATPLCLPAELVASTGFLLARLGIGIKLRVMDELESAGFSGYHYGVLALLGEGATETQGRIADVLGLDRSQLVGELDALEERGLIERRRDTTDRRRHTVALTPTGKRQLTKLRTIVKRIEDSFLEPLDEDERARLHDTLLRVARSHDRRYERADEVA
jgi:DNA-binding MarR family transcriptional regulator